MGPSDDLDFGCLPGSFRIRMDRVGPSTDVTTAGLEFKETILS
jgi:hypothetical protein